MTRPAPLFGLLLAALTSAPALAATPDLTAAPGSGDSEGRVGSFQLMLQAPPIVAETAQAGRGFAINQGVIKGGGTFGTVGAGAGVGYTLTSLFEVGGALAFAYSGDTPTYQFSVEPFVKLNLGPTLHTGALNPFVLGGLGIAAVGFGDGTGGETNFAEVIIDVDPGVEWLFGGRWGVDAYLPIHFLAPIGNIGRAESQVGFTLGFAYGLVGYL